MFSKSKGRDHSFARVARFQATDSVKCMLCQLSVNHVSAGYPTFALLQELPNFLKAADLERLHWHSTYQDY
jgi:hypothetical protein